MMTVSYFILQRAKEIKRDWIQMSHGIYIQIHSIHLFVHLPGTHSAIHQCWMEDINYLNLQIHISIIWRHFVGFWRQMNTHLRGWGVDIDDIGSHSVRKGSAARWSTGCTVSPPMASICLCVRWSMDPMRERYIHYKKAGDQFVGRTVCRLNCMSTEFGISPCYFDFTGIHEEDRQSTQDSIDETIKQLIVGGMELAPKP